MNHPSPITGSRITSMGKDYSAAKSKPIDFTIDGDTFYATGRAPGGTIMDLAAVEGAGTELEQVRAIDAFMEQVLLPDSWDLWIERWRDSVNPIDLDQALEIFSDLVEAYTKKKAATPRPTQDHLPSASGRSRTGTSSRASAGSAGSTPKKRASAPS